ncbi:hypothetical protein [Nocardia sp. CS682]|uniref:hypothetical protein n=1 Tax=Nocardia sp. CS682 TaxID=1047172 RepID=UPI0010753AD2|nr:hypothetical protein [Nocardia sp. CS682]QBS39011.1 hypothetical protein DMB37_01685 [Nocardia sp. CS682]
MIIQTANWIGSTVTPESAYRAVADKDSWRLSWLPDRALTPAQARAGMELDELLSDPDAVHDRMAQARVAACADHLGILREHAVILLAKRMAARLRRDQTVPHDHSGVLWGHR